MTKFGALKLNRNQVMILETWLKIPYKRLQLCDSLPQNHINSKFFHDFRDIPENGQT